MGYVRPVARRLPDGSIGAVLPFHISYEGLEKAIICKDDEDCDTLVKCMVICARRKNVIIIIYAVVSNHAHLAVLARNIYEAKAYAREVKRMYSQLFSRKYGSSKVLHHTDVDVQLLDNDWYLRNALAYIPRNAYFRSESSVGKGREVSDMTRRECREVLHTGDNLGDVPWKVNSEGELEPDSFCDIAYLERAFNNDETFFHKSVGGVNMAEMTQKLVVSPRQMKTDAEFLKEVEAISLRWFMTGVRDLPSSRKARLIPYVYHTMKTTVPQLARIFGLSRNDITRLLNIK